MAKGQGVDPLQTFLTGSPPLSQAANSKRKGLPDRRATLPPSLTTWSLGRACLAGRTTLEALALTAAVRAGQRGEGKGLLDWAMPLRRGRTNSCVWQASAQAARPQQPSCNDKKVAYTASLSLSPSAPCLPLLLSMSTLRFACVQVPFLRPEPCSMWQLQACQAPQPPATHLSASD